jgi:RNA polymerase sigma-70 factor (ECF subfamily)
LDLQKLNYINFSKKELDTLFKSALEGNSKSFEELSGYIDDVDDLTNNIYLTFAEQYHKIDNLEFWLRRVLFLNFVNWYKKSKAKKTFQLEEAYYLKDKDTNPGDNVDAEKILSILSKLSQDKQNIIKLRFYQDLKFGEIAEIMNKSEDAVKKMFYRTIEEIKNKF